MSVFKYLFDTEWMQRADIERLSAQQRMDQSNLRHLRAKVPTLQQLREIEDDLGELALFCRASIDILLEKGVITRAEFAAKMKQIDASDGATDKQYRKPRPKPGPKPLK